MIFPTWLLPLLLAVGDPVLTTTVDGKDKVIASVVTATQEGESGRWQRLNDAHDRSRAGHPAESLPEFDALLAEYEKLYPPGPTRWYVARDMGESLMYSIMATTELEGSGQTTAQVLIDVAWADVYFAKGWALVELRRLDEARAALDRALQLSPSSSEYLIERAEVSKLERKWDQAMADFKSAEDYSTFSPEDARQAVKAQAMRGQAFVLVEQGDYDAAEKVLRAVLKIDANDQRAKQELEYIANARKQQR
jgi:tetratricopeptide (TPR) repeat protein